jgi:hypothetical protein
MGALQVRTGCCESVCHSFTHRVLLCAQVYREPLCRRHYSSILSSAALFRAISFILAVVLSFLLAYATGGFWKKVGSEVIQPKVHYSGDGLLILEVSDSLSCGNHSSVLQRQDTPSIKQQHLYCNINQPTTSLHCSFRAEYCSWPRAGVDHLTCASSGAHKQQAVGSCTGGLPAHVSSTQQCTASTG